MRRTACLSLLLVGLGLLMPREAHACGTSGGWFGAGGSGGLWQRPPREGTFEPHTIILMGNEALGIPAGVEVDLSEPVAEPRSAIARLLDGLEDLVALAASR